MDRPEIAELPESATAKQMSAALADLRPFAEYTLASDSPDLEFLELFADLSDLHRATKAAEALTARATSALAETEVEDEVADEEEADAEGEAEVEDEAADEVEDEVAEDDAEAEADVDAAATDTETVESSGEATEDDLAAEDGSTENEESEVDRPSAEDLSGESTTDDVEGQTPQVLTTARVMPGVPGFEANATPKSNMDVAKALAAKWGTVADSGSGERFTVVQLQAEYPDFANFSDGNVEGFYDDSIVAACAPLQPYYGVGFYSSEARPTFNSLPKFQAPRGGVSIYASPLFSDGTIAATGDGVGQWTHTDDNNSAATKADPYDFECGSTTDFKIYGVYRSMTVRNLDALTFPELVAAHKNQLGAYFARYADTLILDAMVARASLTVNASATYGAVRTVLSRFDQIGAAYREKERLEDNANLDVWMHRWVRNALRQDVIRANNDRGVPEVVVDATIASWFDDIGLTPHFVYDTPTSQTAPTVQTTGVLAGNPDTMWYILSPRGNLGILDLGTIDIGVNPTGTYRDTSLVKRNRFQMFMESFEGIVDRGAPVWSGQIDILPNGAAPAGDTLISSNTLL